MLKSVAWLYKTGDIRHALLSLQMAALSPTRRDSSLGRAERLTGGSRCDKNSQNRRTKRGVKHGSKAFRAGCDDGDFDACIDGVSNGVTGAGTGTRDTFLSQFHALGKLLHAKRLPVDIDRGEGKRGVLGNPEERGQLGFVPEEVLSQGGMDVDWALSFLQYHCVDFFTDDDGMLYAVCYGLMNSFVYEGLGVI